MKTLLYSLSVLAAFMFVGSAQKIEISTKWLGDRIGMQNRITAAVEDYSAELLSIGEGLRAAQATASGEQKALMNSSLQSLDAIMQHQDAAGASGLLPLVNLLHTHNTDESPRILPTIENSRAQISLNYFIDRIFTARMTGAAGVVDEQEMEAMLRFYAGNPAQTSEGSWQTTNTMLFVFGDRVLNTLATKVPDRIDAFYKAVQDARKSAQSGPGPDEESIPDSERPTAGQLRAYEAAFVRLEALVATGTLPKADLPSQSSPTQVSPLPQNDPAVQPPPTQSSATKPTPTRSEEPTSSTWWSVIVILMAAAIGLACLLLKKRK